MVAPRTLQLPHNLGATVAMARLWTYAIEFKTALTICTNVKLLEKSHMKDLQFGILVSLVQFKNKY